MKKNLTKNYKYAFLFLCAVFLSGALYSSAQTTSNSTQSQAQTNTPTSPSLSSMTPAQTPNQHYLLDIMWDSTDNTLKLKDGTNISLTNTSLVKDSGSGSQFYSMVADDQGKFAISSKTKTTKYYLGKWELPSGQKQGEIKVTVPYLVNGAKLIIADAKTNKAALIFDISKLSQPEVSTVAKASAVPPAVKLQMNQASSSAAILGWVIIIIIILILGGGGYWYYRFRKKRKEIKMLATVKPPVGQNKI